MLALNLEWVAMETSVCVCVYEFILISANMYAYTQLVWGQTNSSAAFVAMDAIGHSNRSGQTVLYNSFASQLGECVMTSLWK